MRLLLLSDFIFPGQALLKREIIQVLDISLLNEKLGFQTLKNFPAEPLILFLHTHKLQHHFMKVFWCKREDRIEQVFHFFPGKKKIFRDDKASKEPLQKKNKNLIF